MKVGASHNLKKLFPKIAKEWDYLKNDIRPEEVAPKSGVKVWWICKEGHSWQATVKDRHKHNCPYCAGQKPTECNNLLKENPSFLKEWDFDKNPSPAEFCPKSNKKVWWRCENNHEWISSIYIRYKHGCPYCSGRLASEETSICNFPNLLKEWDYEKNKINPKEVSAFSHKIIWRKCEKGHSWRSSVKTMHIAGCPYCSGRLASKENNITLNNELMKEWSNRNKISPKSITISSHMKVWWCCEKGHEWKQSPNGKTPCPYCSKSKPSKEYNLQTERPEIAKLWHPKNKLDPHEVLPMSSKAAWWKCSCGNEYVRKISSCAIRCPKCSKRSSIASKKWLDCINIEKREHYIRINKKIFYVDGFKDDVVYEFLGAFWHGDPRIYDPNIRNCFNNKKFGTLLFQTIKRLNILSKHYKVIYCWEHELKNKEYKYITNNKDNIICLAKSVYKTDLDILEILKENL